jgi:hypothetical protein
VIECDERRREKEIEKRPPKHTHTQTHTLKHTCAFASNESGPRRARKDVDERGVLEGIPNLTPQQRVRVLPLLREFTQVFLERYPIPE